MDCFVKLRAVCIIKVGVTRKSCLVRRRTNFKLSEIQGNECWRIKFNGSCTTNIEHKQEKTFRGSVCVNTPESESTKLMVSLLVGNYEV